MKTTHAISAILGASAILLGGCGSSTQPATSPDVPSAVETTPASPATEGAKTEAPPPASAAPSAKP